MADKIWVGGASGAAGDLNTADNWAPISIRSSTYQWTASGSGTSEYYLELSGGGDPSLTEPGKVKADGSDLTAGSAGTLAAGEWDWADNDTLGFSTIYVRLSDSTDPDAKAAGYVTYTQVLKAGDNVTIQGTQAISDGLDQSSIELGDFIVTPGYSGTIGSATGYLQIDVGNSNRFDFAGTGKAYIDLGGAAIDPVIRNTATVTTGAGLYLKGTALDVVEFRKGDLEIVKGSTVATIYQLYTSTQASDTDLTIPPGVTLTTLSKTGGTCSLSVAATTVSNDGGTLTTEGSGAITTLNVSGGNVYPNSTGTITTLNADGGATDFTRTRASRTVTTINRTGDASVTLDPDVVTVTNAIDSDGPFSITAA